MTDSDEQRDGPRLDAKWTAVWWTRDRRRTNHGIVRDVSPEGFFLELPGTDIDADMERMHLECLLPDGTVSRIEGDVVWRGRKRGRHGVGVRLEQTDSAFKNFLRSDSDTQRLPRDVWSEETGESQLVPPRSYAVDRRRNYLVMMTGPHAGASYELEGAITIGRHPRCDVVLLDASASRRHTAIRRSGEALLLDDLGSSNGTFVNGKRVHQCPLEDGDRVQIGSSQLKVFSDDDLEVRLRHAQKMESLGRLASGAAHDFNNILSVVTASASLISEKSDSLELKQLARSILDASEHAATITRQMLGMARRSEFHRQSFELRRLVKGLETTLRQRVNDDIELSVDVDSDLWLLADYGQLEQVVLNLFNNAVDSITQAGVISLRADATKLDMDEAADLHLRPGDYIRLVLTDSGCGMDEETLKRSLEPYFTTKAIGYGTGLGLPMARGIVEAHEGAISLNSDAGAGTRVSIWLPHSAAQTLYIDQDAATSPTVTQSLEPRTVLLVDSDAEVRLAVGEMLSFLGCRVVEASDEGEAMQRLEEIEAETPTLAIVDVRLSQGSGYDIAESLQKRRPLLDVVLCSSGLEGEVPNRFAERFLRKPFELGALAAMLMRLG